MNPDYAKRVHDHVNDFFLGHETRREVFDEGPIQTLAPGFHSIVVDPGPKSQLWTYVSVGAGLLGQAQARSLEFLITAIEPSAKHTERLAMTAFYHHTETLGIGHTFPVGEPWLPDSALDHGLISLPYPFGPDLEILDSNGERVHFYWVLPITAEERAYRHAQGMEALESAFDEAELRYWDEHRRSVV